ncbi:MAG TPA: hypothetical protein VK469_04995, partial [Candidatus Kapabacteria bacterium]|nr:hypothetical protein [Candidatus Kapabacteria bacterium]
LGLKDKAAVERLLHLAEDEEQDGELRLYFAFAVGHSGLKDKAVEILLHLAEDEKQAGRLRVSCAFAVGGLVGIDKTVEILIDLYLAEPDKNSSNARFIYISLWELTAV